MTATRVPSAQTRDTFANRGNEACDLVPQRHGLLDAHRAEAAMVIIMQIGTADAAIGDLDAHLARPRHGVGKIIDPQILRRMNYDGTHGLFSPVIPFEPSHRGEHAAVDIDDLAVDVSRCLGGQENRGTDQLVRTPPAF